MFLKEGYRAPGFRIATVGGTSRSLQDYRGAPTLVYGWASWDSSRDVLPALQRFHQSHGAAVRVVSIAFDAQGPGFAMKYLKPAGAGFEMLIDATCVLSRRWGVKTVPFLVLLDAEGTVQKVLKSVDEKTLASLPEFLTKKQPGNGDLDPSLLKSDINVDRFVQGCAIFLSRNRVADAANSLREALKLDPKNEIIRRQIAELEERRSAVSP